MSFYINSYHNNFVPAHDYCSSDTIFYVWHYITCGTGHRANTVIIQVIPSPAINCLRAHYMWFVYDVKDVKLFCCKIMSWGKNASLNLKYYICIDKLVIIQRLMIKKKTINPPISKLWLISRITVHQLLRTPFFSVEDGWLAVHGKRIAILYSKYKRRFTQTASVHFSYE